MCQPLHNIYRDLQEYVKMNMQYKPEKVVKKMSYIERDIKKRIKDFVSRVGKLRLTGLYYRLITGINLYEEVEHV